MYTEEKPDLDSLMHYGKLGMKWGVHKEKMAAIRKKAVNVANNKYAQGSDRKRAKYISQPVGARIAKTASTYVAQYIISDILTGKIGSYKNMSKSQIAKRVSTIAKMTAEHVVLSDALAKSAMKNYTDKGATVRGTKRSTKLVTKEDAIEYGITVGVKAARVGAKLGGTKLMALKMKRQMNEDRFNSWGKNILPQSTDNVLWANNDYAVIDNRGR